jgi:predicted TIM-barrel fold metal-dependent hydrolase
MRWPVIDSHFHLGINPLIHFTVEELFCWMDEGGVDVQMVFQVNEGFVHQTPDWNPFIGNDFIARVQHERPERIIGLAMVNPWHQLPPRPLIKNAKVRALTRAPALEEIDRAIGELGLWGLKMHPLESHYQFNNPRIVFPVLERLTNIQRLVGRRLVVLVHAGGDTLNNSPEAVADTAHRFPELLFIAAHAGYKWAIPTVAHTMAAEPNVLIDLTTAAGVRALEEVYRQYGPTKFCTGSDGPFATNRCKDAIVRGLTGGDLEAEALIRGGNLAQHFGIGQTDTAVVGTGARPPLQINPGG